jgi:large subunit ribosomal protein L24e
MPKCTYCGKEYEFPRGVTLVQTDGKITYLCSSKCRKNRKLQRRNVRWIHKSIKSEK